MTEEFMISSISQAALRASCDLFAALITLQGCVLKYFSVKKGCSIIT